MNLTARIGAGFTKQKFEGLAISTISKIFMIGMAALLFQAGKPVYAVIEIPNPIPSILPLEKSKALESYQKRPQSEISKLIYLKELLQKSAYTVIYDGKSYNPRSIAPAVAAYFGINYKKESAEDWIRKHAYRSYKGHIIFLKDAQGEMTVLRDFLLEELTNLPR